MRVLMLATYFPKPMNPLMGNWALSQAQALARHGVEVEVVSLTALIPKALARTPGARAYSFCPAVYDWGDLRAHYPRWMVYPVGPIKKWTERHPALPMALGWLTARRFLEGWIRQFRPDVIFAHHTAVNGYLASLLQPSTGLPYVITDHDLGEIASCAELPARRRFFEPVVRNASTMVAVASRMEHEMRQLFPYARTRTVHNGADPVPQDVLSTPRPEHLRNKRVIFSCGAFYPRKGFPTLIEAFARIAPQYPDCVLRIAGDGAQRPEVEQAIRRHGLESRVELLGFQPHRTVQLEMVWSDVFALIGWDEPFATVYSEAMAAGKPIVCCDDGGFNDVLENGIQGFAVAPRDVEAAAEAMGHLVGNPDLCARMGRAAGRLFENRLHWAYNAQTMIGIFENALAGKPAMAGRA